MPQISLTLAGGTDLVNDWEHVSVPLVQLQTFLNNIGLDDANVQANGLVPANLRSRGVPTGPRFRVRNNSGAAISRASLVGFRGTHFDGTNRYPQIVRAQATQTPTTTIYAEAIVESTIADGADGTVVPYWQDGDLDTTGAAGVGRPVFLSTTVGAWTTALPVPENRIQVVGLVSVHSLIEGRITFHLPGTLVPWSIADQV